MWLLDYLRYTPGERGIQWKKATNQVRKCISDAWIEIWRWIGGGRGGCYFFFFSWCFNVSKNLFWGDCPSQDSEESRSLICKLANPKPYLLSLAQTPQEAILLFLNHPRASFQATRDHLYSLELAETTQSSQLTVNPACLALTANL
jgi:hypothetical protein